MAGLNSPNRRNAHMSTAWPADRNPSRPPRDATGRLRLKKLAHNAFQNALSGRLRRRFALVRQVGQITPHSGGGVLRLDSHNDQSANYFVRGDGGTDVVIDHMNAGKPILGCYSRGWRRGTAPDALGVTHGARFSVSRRRTHRHSNGDADRRSGVDKTHPGIIARSSSLTTTNSHRRRARGRRRWVTARLVPRPGRSIPHRFFLSGAAAGLTLHEK